MTGGTARGSVAMSTVRWIAVVVLVVFGIYLAAFHPSHEDIGLGKNHIAHTVVGIVLLMAAGYVWWSGRGKAAVAPAQ